MVVSSLKIQFLVEVCRENYFDSDPRACGLDFTAQNSILNFHLNVGLRIGYFLQFDSPVCKD